MLREALREKKAGGGSYVIETGRNTWSIANQTLSAILGESESRKIEKIKFSFDRKKLMASQITLIHIQGIMSCN